MEEDDRWMHRCLELARKGAGSTAPNPLVGAVLVGQDRILAEGWHHAWGRPHAEVECLRAFGEGQTPMDATLYVNLEPCSHHGKTPPCADTLIARGVRRVVVAHRDPNPLVAGKGLARLRAAGVEVVEGVCEDEAKWLNRRFFTLHEEGRPYVVLKWARSADGFLDDHGRTARISSADTDVLVHRWRSEEQSILVGGRTVMNDDPQLTVRLVDGRSPVRIVLDRIRRTAPTSRVYDGTAPTLLVTEVPDGPHEAGIILHPSGPDLESTLELLLRKELAFDGYMAQFGLPPIASIFVEGGATVLRAFMATGLWDEARVITGATRFGAGTASPVLEQVPIRTLQIGPDRIDLFSRTTSPPLTWSW
ncbi:MAG: bifunctional diaminohydroxyphosphoribosylaminopyrimidine deaminase/5-amino-6-(5-phosphoribosylamino)uracil reductase RibD [Flavobacteriales bacterium]|nr:bifunctional diaminohydroxyphosphoribosylaminopyrimidine deaminase/5-amino-6-(5-phosphoribosylamino)uracil reductase RibD [Flavobacteriales bacterium]